LKINDMKKSFESNSGCFVLILILLTIIISIICIKMVIDMDEVRHIPEPFRQYGIIEKK